MLHTFEIKFRDPIRFRNHLFDKSLGHCRSVNANWYAKINREYGVEMQRDWTLETVPFRAESWLSCKKSKPNQHEINVFSGVKQAENFFDELHFADLICDGHYVPRKVMVLAHHRRATAAGTPHDTLRLNSISPTPSRRHTCQSHIC